MCLSPCVLAHSEEQVLGSDAGEVWEQEDLDSNAETACVPNVSG